MQLGYTRWQKKGDNAFKGNGERFVLECNFVNRQRLKA